MKAVDVMKPTASSALDPQLVRVAEQAASSVLGYQVVEMIRIVRDETYPVWLFYNVDFRKVVDDQKFTDWLPLFYSEDLELRDPPCNMRTNSEDTNSKYEVLTFDSMVNLVAFCKWVMKPIGL